MRIKQRIDDFRVRELLAEGYLQERGEHRVYRVTKRKLTTLQAAHELARAAGVQASDVALAGLKDRQGVTTQHMTVRRGRDVSFRAHDLSVETVGFAQEPLESRHSLGNAFEVALRGLVQEDLDTLRDNVQVLRECGVVNYFDEQRFGNLRHNQGWIAQQLMRGEHEAALQRLLASISAHDDEESTAFKRGLLAAWGDWSACRDIAGRFGKHHSVFEHLKQHDGDFAGAFYHVSSRLRLIHLYAFQSHLWNRAVTDCVASFVPREERVVLDSVEGPLVYPSRPLPPAAGTTFRLPGAGLEDVTDAAQRGWLEDALSRERMVAADFRIEGVPGFQLKGEDRELLLQPRHLRVRPPDRDQLNFGAFVVKVRFELQRGAYATLVVRRLLSTPQRAAGRERGADRGEHDPRFRRAAGDGARGAARDQRSSRPDKQRREPLPQHRESGESLALPPRDPPWKFRRDERGHGDGDRGGHRSFQRRREFGPRGPSPDSFGGPGREERSRGFGERGSSERGFGQRGFDQRGFDQRGSGERGHGQRGYGQRNFDQRGFGQRGFDQRGSGDRGYGQPGSGARGFGERGSGGRGFGQHGSGERGYGQRGSGERGFGERGPGERGYRPRGFGERGDGQRGSGDRGGSSRRSQRKPGGERPDDDRPRDER